MITVNNTFEFSFSSFIAMSSRENEASLLGKSVLQSTFSDNPRFRPDLDISVIKGKLKENSKMLKMFYGSDCPVTLFFVLSPKIEQSLKMQ